MITATALTRTFGRTTALDGVDVTIEDGEFVAIMGPSGSGKSTLLYALSGIDTPTSGTVQIQGHEITAMSQKKLAEFRLERLGFVFQQPRLVSTLSLLDNVILPARVSGKFTREDIEARARALMERADVAKLADRSTTEASGGQLQRVALCRALVNQSEILFCDEPTGALNTANAARVLDLISEQAAAGTTVVMVTHDATVAAAADRVLMLADGRIVGDRRMTGTRDTRRAELLAWLGEAGV